MKTNYVFAKYDFPLPNNGNNYSFTQEELVKLLDHVYDRGWQHAKEIYDTKSYTVTTTSAESWKGVPKNE